jgi:nucleoside-diphosphate-sugar epimerase
MNRKILIIGGTGFVGGYVKEYLMSKNYSIDFTSRATNLGINYDANTDDLMSCVGADYDIVINNVNPQRLDYNIALKHDESVINYCKKHSIRLLHISSVSALYNNKSSDSYNLKKYFSEEIIRQELGDDQYTILRFPQLFDESGLARHSQHGLYYLLDHVKRNASIKVFSNYANCFRNYLPVELAVQMIFNIIENSLTGVINGVIGDHTMSLMDLLNIITILNADFDKNNISIGENKGVEYTIKDGDADFINLLNYHSLGFYLQKAYNHING